MEYNTPDPLSILQIEAEARRLRAEYIRSVAKTAIRWTVNAFSRKAMPQT